MEFIDTTTIITGDVSKALGHLQTENEHLRAGYAAAQAAPVSRDWFPVDGNTRGYKGDIVLRHYKQKDQYRLGHTDWIGAHEVTPYSPSGTAKPVAAWKGTIERMGLDTWMPLGDFTAQAAPVDTESVLDLLAQARAALWQPANAALCERLDAAIAAKQGGANG